ncbi:hypothetical protein V8E55_010011, partial [Tylopilus felleus]
LLDLVTLHALAKLQLHTEQTLNLFDSATIYLGESTQKFQHTMCQYYQMTELPQEHTARGHCTATLSGKKVHMIGTSTTSSSPKEKKLNLSIYKFHMLGEYPDTICRFGTTDSYTS